MVFLAKTQSLLFFRFMANALFDSPPQGIIFDCDGTLADSMPLHYVAWSRTLSRHGLDFPETKFYSMGGTPTDKIVEILSEEQGVAVDAGAVADEKEALFLELLHEVTAIDEVVAVAREAAGRGIAVSVASGGSPHVVKQTLEAIGLADFFSIIVTPEQVAHGKPAPDSFLLAAEKMGTLPAETMVFEDSDPGETATRAAGMMLTRVYSTGPADARQHRLARRF